jgi:hypothetical protein
MNNPKYLVNISLVPRHLNGQTEISVGGSTQSFPTYSSEYFIASMPEIRISATGSDYQEALTNLLIVASASTITGPEPLGNIRTW